MLPWIGAKEEGKDTPVNFIGSNSHICVRARRLRMLGLFFSHNKLSEAKCTKNLKYKLSSGVTGLQSQLLERLKQEDQNCKATW